jgi:hypothetical protein
MQKEWHKVTKFISLHLLVLNKHCHSGCLMPCTMTYYQLAKEKHERITWSANWSLSFFLSADNLWYQVWLQVLYYK